MAARNLTLERLHELLHYEPSTGIFRWKDSRNRRVNPGDIAGSSHSERYVVIRIDGKSYKAHRLAWFYMTGTFPPEETDHKNGIRWDNSYDNLRLASKTINQQNRREAQKGSGSGVLGVFPRKNGKFRAAIAVNGKRKCIGTFETKELAYAAYIQAKRRLHPSCTI